jgi:putative iron-dependent peroxidase
MLPLQPGILAPVPRLAVHVFFVRVPGVDPRACLSALARAIDPASAVVGLGESVALEMGASIPGLRSFAGRSGKAGAMPSTPFALWCWLRGNDRGELLHELRSLQSVLRPAFEPDSCVDSFQFEDGRDLTGYEDGTENPRDADAIAAAACKGHGAGLDGSSFVAVQQWLHDLDRFASMSTTEQDAMMGRRRSDNEEIEDAPESAHVKRTAQESFDPAAFVLRRSMPWAEGARAGLVFLAFGKSFDAFEALLNRMMGFEDGITDALFRFTRPLTGAYFWCPPVTGDGRIDLRALGL